MSLSFSCTFDLPQEQEGKLRGLENSVFLQEFSLLLAYLTILLHYGERSVLPLPHGAKTKAMKLVTRWVILNVFHRQILEHGEDCHRNTRKRSVPQ